MQSISPKDDVIVTIGLCVKNSEATLKEAIESILYQDYPTKKMELIVVEGHSRDKTHRILEENLRDTKLKTRLFSENEGLGSARQTVVDNASGEYIVWVDGDMVIAEDFVRRQVEFMKNHPCAGVAKGKYGTRQNNAHESIVATLENIEFLLATVSEGETNAKALGTSGCIYSVAALRQVNGFDTNIRGVGEDRDVENRMRNNGWKLYISSAVFFETRRQTWRSLWKEYYWHGSGGQYMFQKNRPLLNLTKMLPPVAILAEFRRLPAAYKLTHHKYVLFLPLHYVFKRIAWFLGFTNSLWKNKSSGK